ncbi:MAG: hypothetical protein A2026_03845 [Deltaproteobacteria bacterium RBG_19FT_COMBO_46_12]|jgi:hypothetical protein|nr:MAG: hypothetical protein A2026_03845 [Deltaproteobacteria bacterium RBG_19FT_COMBO_46_12]
MKLQRILLLKLIVVIATLFIFHPAFSQVTREETISFSGTIDSIPKDPKFIVVNERRVYISSNTKIANTKGSILKRNDLKRGLGVSIEGVQKPEGIFAGKITVLLTPKIKP